MANTIKVNIYKGENYCGTVVEGQLLVIDGTPVIIPTCNRFGYNETYMEFDGHHLRQGDYDSPLWVKPSTVQFVETMEMELK